MLAPICPMPLLHICTHMHIVLVTCLHLHVWYPCYMLVSTYLMFLYILAPTYRLSLLHICSHMLSNALIACLQPHVQCHCYITAPTCLMSLLHIWSICIMYLLHACEHILMCYETRTKTLSSYFPSLTH